MKHNVTNVPVVEAVESSSRGRAAGANAHVLSEHLSASIHPSTHGRGVGRSQKKAPLLLFVAAAAVLPLRQLLGA